MPQHSSEYLNYLKSNRWAFIRWINNKIWFGRCAFRPWQKATQCHHLHYHTAFGWERPLWDTIPVSTNSHKLLEKPPWKVKIKAGNRWISQPKIRAKMNKRLRKIAFFNWFVCLLIFIVWLPFGIVFLVLKFAINPFFKLLNTNVLHK